MDAQFRWQRRSRSGWRQRLQLGDRSLRLWGRGRERFAPGGCREGELLPMQAARGRWALRGGVTAPSHLPTARERGQERGNPPESTPQLYNLLDSHSKNKKNKEGFGKGMRFGKLCLTCCCVLGPWTVCHLWRTLSCSQTPASPLCCSSPPNAGVKSHLCHAAVVPTPAFVRVRLGDACEKKKEKRDKKTPNPRSQSIC